MNRLNTLQASVGALLSMAAIPPPGRPAGTVALPELAFAVGIGSNRGVGVLFDDPVLVVQDPRGERRLLIPRADLDGDARWQLASEPLQPSTSDVKTAPGSDVIYGRIRDRATALCRGTGGVYVAMLAFPTLPYLVHYHADRNEFKTFPLPSSQPVIGLFQQPSRLYYFIVDTADLRSIVTATG